MPRIFISYRRDDSSGHAGRLFDELCNQFGRDQVFMDIDTLEPGQDFVNVLENAVGSCDAPAASAPNGQPSEPDPAPSPAGGTAAAPDPPRPAPLPSAAAPGPPVASEAPGAPTTTTAAARADAESPPLAPSREIAGPVA